MQQQTARRSAARAITVRGGGIALLGVAGIGLAALAAAMALGGCAGGSDPPPPPVTVSLVAPDPVDVREADNPLVEITVQAASPAHSGATVSLALTGSATRDHDYAISGDSVVLAPNTRSASVTVDVYRDFDQEGDETITVTIGEITGRAQPGAPSAVTITVLDGEAATVDKAPYEGDDDEGFLALLAYRVTETAVEFAVTPFDVTTDGEPVRLIAEWSREADFATDVNRLDDAVLAVPDDELISFFDIYEFRLPLARVAANGRYYLRAYIESLGPDEEGTVLVGFATDETGQVITRCRAPMNGAGMTGADPLFDQQWHLQNTGQTGFSETAGVAGADLQMRAAIDAGRDGGGVKLAIVDSGLEICHPDLAANIEPGKSFNFGHAISAGASLTDPYNHMEVFGDHGTSVAGVAAAVAGNGVGGRGVAPAVRLRGFNVGAGQDLDTEADLLASLGGSSRDPDSASADIFNMSFGVELPAANATDDFIRLYSMGVNELRSGKGALYVKSAGNEFGFCEAPHPLQADIGCVNSNADPDHNLPYLIIVGAFNARDVKSSYSNAGAQLWVVAPAGEDGIEEPGLITADQMGPGVGYPLIVDDPLDGHPLNGNGDYMAAFGGTSGAAGAASGALAVLLGVQPDLTWRDVRHILAKTARRIDPDRPRVRAAFNGTPYVAQHAWRTNAAGYGYHNWYGFGAIAIDDAVAMAANYTPDSLGRFVESGWHPAEASSSLMLPIPDADGGGVTGMLTVSGLPDTASIEAVVLEISATHSYASDLGITITSPGGTESIVNPPFNVVLDHLPELRQWRLLSNAFYGEKPNGEWTIRVADVASGDTGELESWRLRFYYGEHPED